MRSMWPALAFVLALAPVAVHAEERLVLEPYPAATPWKLVTNEAHGGLWLREQIPADQSLEAYRDILTSQALLLSPGDTPSALIGRITSGAANACEHVSVNGPKAAREGGYAVAYAQVYCSRQNGQPFGVTMFFKVIRGEGAMYSVNRDFRVPPSDVAGVMSFPPGEAAQVAALMSAQTAADAYLVRSVFLCGTRATDRRCR